MSYEFITNFSIEDYYKLISKQLFIHYKSESNWDLLSNNKNTFFLALKNKNKILCCAKAEIKNNNYLFISNIYFITKDEIIMSLFINEIIRFAKEKKLYKVKINDFNIEKRLNLKVKNTEIYNYINLYSKGKILTKAHFTKLFKQDNNKLLTTKKATKKDIEKLYKSIEHWNIKLDFNLNELLKTYKSNCTILIEYLDLVYYLETIQDNSNISVDTIEELISEYGEEMIVGFSIVLGSHNNINSHCISFYTIDAFTELPIKNNLLLETIYLCLKKKYKNIIFYNNVDTNNKIVKYSYEKVLKPFKNLLLKLQKKED